MKYFLRYSDNPEIDLERNASLHLSDLDASNIDAESAANSFGCDVEDLIEVDGLWCQKLEGLCAFELEAETLEEAIKEAEEFNFNGVYNSNVMGDLITIFTGEFEDYNLEGVIFTAKEIVYTKK